MNKKQRAIMLGRKPKRRASVKQAEEIKYEVILPIGFFNFSTFIQEMSDQILASFGVRETYEYVSLKDSNTRRE